VPVGLFLSGGVDSNAIAALAKAAGAPPLTSITLGFPAFAGGERDETALAAQAARQHGFRHVTRWVDRREFAEDRERILAAMDQPSIDGANTWFAAKAAKEAGIKVALSGIGGDELFGSYPSFRQVPALVRKLRPVRHLPQLGVGLRAVSAGFLRRVGKPKWAGIVEYGTSIEDAYLLRRGLFMPWELPQLIDPELARAGWLALEPRLRLSRSIAGIANERAAMSALELAWYMRNQLLRDADWAGLAHGVEIRPPFVDLPLLRRLGPLILSQSPPTKADLLGCLPEPLPLPLGQKRGFVVPWREWVSEEGGGQLLPVRRWAKTVLDAQLA
jgi:asparagine synthase (glutamine-hydrolysing)